MGGARFAGRGSSAVEVASGGQGMGRGAEDLLSCSPAHGLRQTTSPSLGGSSPR